MNIDISNSLTIAIETIALLEAVKVFIKKKNWNIPSWVYTVLSLIVSFGLAIIQCDSFVWSVINTKLPIGLLAFSISQLGYDTILKAIKKKLEGNNE